MWPGLLGRPGGGLLDNPDPVMRVWENLPLTPAPYGTEMRTAGNDFRPLDTTDPTALMALRFGIGQTVPQTSRLYQMATDAATNFAGTTPLVRRDPSSASGMRFLLNMDGSDVGQASVIGEPGARFLDSIMINSPARQRSGRGQEIYDEIESLLGEKLVPSPLGLYPPAEAIWRRRLAALPVEEAQGVLRRADAAGVSMGANPQNVRDRLSRLLAEGYGIAGLGILSGGAFGGGLLSEPTIQ